MAKKSGRTTIDDIPIVFSCPQCGKEVETDLRGFEDKCEFVCRLGAHVFWLSDEQHLEIFQSHSKRIGNIGGQFQ